MDKGQTGLDIVLLCCERAAAERISDPVEGPGFTVRSAVLPCGSKADIPHFLRILEGGVDGVEVAACPEGECRQLVGSARLLRRVERARELLAAAGVGAERLGATLGRGMSRDELLKLAQKRAEAVVSLGWNPLKGEKP